MVADLAGVEAGDLLAPPPHHGLQPGGDVDHDVIERRRPALYVAQKLLEPRAQPSAQQRLLTAPALLVLAACR